MSAEVIRIVLEAVVVLVFIAGLLNEKKIIRFEDRMIGKARRWRGVQSHIRLVRRHRKLVKTVSRRRV